MKDTSKRLPVAEQIRKGLEEGIRHARGEITLKTPEQGAATSVYVATAPTLEGVGGRYYEDCAESPVVDRRENQGVARYALDADNADRLWALSEAAVGRHVKVG